MASEETALARLKERDMQRTRGSWTSAGEPAERIRPPVRSRPTDPEPKVKNKKKTAAGWDLRLYVAGETPRSRRAIANLQKICDEHLKGECRVEVIDVTKNPALARGDQILALPTLVRRLPPPLKRIIGDLSNAERVLIGLDLRQPEVEVTMKTRTPRRGRSSGDRYVLRLYVTGQTPRSTRAVENLKRICEEYLEGRYHLEIIDLYQQPELAKTQQLGRRSNPDQDASRTCSQDSRRPV